MSEALRGDLRVYAPPKPLIQQQISDFARNVQQDGFQDAQLLGWHREGADTHLLNPEPDYRILTALKRNYQLAFVAKYTSIADNQTRVTKLGGPGI